MAINIKDREVDRLAREAAALTKQSITGAIKIGLEMLLAQEHRRERGTDRMARELVAIGRRCAELPDLDSRSNDQIVGYDDDGLPQ